MKWKFLSSVLTFWCKMHKAKEWNTWDFKLIVLSNLSLFFKTSFVLNWNFLGTSCNVSQITLCPLEESFLTTASETSREFVQSTHFIHGDSRPTVSIQPVYVTTDKRAAAEDIRNATKEEILRRADEKLELLCDEKIKADLLKKAGLFAKPNFKRKRKGRKGNCWRSE